MRVFHPRSVHVRIAAGCNLGCVFCERENLPEASPGTGRRKRGTLTFLDGRNDLAIEKDMELATWELVKEKLMPHTDFMELGGLGEPTLGKLFPQAAKDIVAAGKGLFFFTNGHYLNLPQVLESVGDTPHISISIDAGTAEAYKRIRKGDLDKLIESVTAFRAAKPNAIIDSQFTAIADNIDEIPRWVELCAKLGIGRTEHGEQLLLIGADHHSTSRVDQSVRFFKDRTLKALAEAVDIAQREGLWLMSRLPAFSEANPNAGDDGSDPRKLRRWADLMFFGENPCGGTDTTDVSAGSCLVVGSMILTQGGRWMAVESLRPGDPLVTVTEKGERRIERVKAAQVVKDQETLKIVHEKGRFECSKSHPLPVPGGELINAEDLRPGHFLIGENGTPIKVSAIEEVGLREVVVLEMEGPNRLYFSGGVWHHNKTVPITENTIVGPPGEELPGAARSMGIPTFGASEDEEREIVTTSKELYVDYDGTVWSCLARHEIGNVATGTWRTIVEDNQAYQEWLANWHYGTSNSNDTCKSCPRRK